MLLTELGITIELYKPLLNALFPMLVIEFGIVTEVRLVQLLNAYWLMLLRDVGMVTEARD